LIWQWLRRHGLLQNSADVVGVIDMGRFRPQATKPPHTSSYGRKMPEP
jgi:hypothetical protein